MVSDTEDSPISTLIDSSKSMISKIVFSEESSSRVKQAFCFMDKRQMYRKIDEVVEITPDDIIDGAYVTMEDIFTHAAYESKQQRLRSDTALKTIKASKSKSDQGMNVYATTINLDDIHIDHTLNTDEGLLSNDVDVERPSSEYCLHIVTRAMSYPPEAFIVLKENHTVFLFELPSFSYEKGSAEGTAIEEENESYQYITVGKGRNRKMVNEETQTEDRIKQTRHTMATRPQKKNAISFASMWDMHDTYAKLALYKAEAEPDEMVLYQSAAPNLLRKKKFKEYTSERSKSFQEIAASPEFNDAAMLVERVLSTLKYSDAQKQFRGLVVVNPLSLDLVYVYSLRPLWTLECEETQDRPITSISFNPRNNNILAVAHGKFVYAEHTSGIVAVWCTKNPCKPERLYYFENPLTSVSFSPKNPNWLACGFANGDVLILDVTSYSIKTIAHSKRDTNPSFDPIWNISWRGNDSISEFVMTTCQDGRINKFTSTKTHDFICSPMMRITSVEGKMKGLEEAKACAKVDVPISRYPAALCMLWHPSVDHVYLVGTDEGNVHKCSTHYLNQHMDVIGTHLGPVYGMDISPFMKTLLVTCGADHAIRLWIEGIDDVIMTLTCSSAVYGIAFCPVNSTIIISISGNALSIWDLRRKTHIPCAQYKFPSGVVLTYIKFCSSGENVFVGDTSGRIHTFHLEDTPIPPFYQKKMLEEAIKKSLCTRPHLLKQLEKLEKFRERYSK